MGTKHTAEFRQEAVRVALASSLTRKQVASDFGIGFSTLSRWVRQDRETFPEPSVQCDLVREVSMLRKENRLLRIALSGYITQIKKKKLPIDEKKSRIIRQRSKINRLIVKRQRAIGKLMYKSQVLLKKRHALVSHPAYLKAKHGTTL